MRSSGWQKRKASGIPQENTEFPGPTLKKSTNKNRLQCQKPAGEKSVFLVRDPLVKPSGVFKSSRQKVLSRNDSLPEVTRVPHLKLQTEEVFSSAKIKLQLFPVNEATRLTLERGGHNPFLELTLSARKKISSIIKHLNTKWGSSSAALGELMLFPYNMRMENISSCRRWTSDNCDITAGDIHEVLGNPAVFRLRYGWFSSLDADVNGKISSKSFPVEAHSGSQNMGKVSNSFSEITCGKTEKFKVFEDQHIRSPINEHEAADGTMAEQNALTEPSDCMGNNANSMSARAIVSWDDSFTGLSIGGLLSEASLLGKYKNFPKMPESKSDWEPILVSDTSIGHLLSEASLQGKITGSKLESKHESMLQQTDSFAEKSSGSLSSEVSFSDKIDNHDLEVENEAGFHAIQLASDMSVGGLLSEASLQGKITLCDTTSDRKTLGLQPTRQNGGVQPPWDDCPATLSIVGLPSEASLQARVHGCDPKSEGNKSNSKSGIPTFDSFDAFLAAQTNSHPQAPKPQLLDSSLSIWDAEETCHAFPFQEISALSKDSMTSTGRDSSGGYCNNLRSKRSRLPRRDMKTMTNSLPRRDGENDEDSSLGLKGIKWNDSRGPFDLGLPMLKPVTGGDSTSEFVR